MAQSSKTFRIFVSSTFSDLKVERNALQKQVFPKLRELCMQHGCRFQAIDLRWGVREEAALDQQTMKICLEEIARCQRVTLRPNFIVLLGDRYGWRPLPAQIEAQEFEAIPEKVSEADRELLVWSDSQPENRKGWYRRDDNAVPPEYCLRPRKVNVPEGASEEKKKAAHEREDQEWRQTEQRLLSILLGAIDQLGWSLDDPRRTKYAASATEQEIDNGALSDKVPDAQDHVFCFFRKIKNLPQDSSAKDFVDLDDRGKPDMGARARLDSLKGKLRGRPVNVYDYKAGWTGNSITTDHITKLCEDVYQSLARVIEEEIARFEEVDALDKEIADHDAFGEERAKFFIGRASILQTVADYVKGGDCHPLVVHGASGSGKSALIAYAVEQVRSKHPEAEIIHRFIGATPRSSDVRFLLRSLCEQIYKAFDYEQLKQQQLATIQGDDEEARRMRDEIAGAYTIPQDMQKLSKTFRDFLAKVLDGKRLVLFLDALDQLSDFEHARNLIWLPAELPENVHLIVSTLPGECLSALEKKRPVLNFVELEPMSLPEGSNLLKLWLADAGRTLQDHQREEVLGKFRHHGLPLYLKLAFEEARRWKSYTDPRETVLSGDIPGIIRHNLSARLSSDANHGQTMVSQSLGYLAAAKNGLTEDELLDVLSRSYTVFKDFLRRARHRPPERRLPVVVWSRLYFDLEPYLTERTADGMTLLAFYHRQLGEVVAADYLADEPKRDRHRALARYFGNQELDFKCDGQTTPNVRKLSELPYQQTLGELWDALFATLTDFSFLERKAAAVGVVDRIDQQGRTTRSYTGIFDLEDDFDLALKKYPWQQQERALVATSIQPLSFAEQCTTLQALAWAIRRESHILSVWPDLLWQQLYNQLQWHDDVLTSILEPELIRRGAAGTAPWFRSQMRNRESHSLIRTLSGHQGDVKVCTFSPDGRWLISGDANGGLKIWDIQTGQEQAALPGHTENIVACALSPDGVTLVSVSHDSNSRADQKTAIKVWDVTTRSERWSLPIPPGGFQQRIVSADATTVVTVQSEPLLKVWDVGTGWLRTTLRSHGKYISCSLVNTQDALIVCEEIGGCVTLLDANTGQKRASWQEPVGTSHAFALSDDGRLMVTNGPENTVQLWDTRIGHRIATLSGHRHAITACAISPAGDFVISGSEDRTVKVWDIATGTLRRTLRGHTGKIKGCFVSFNGDFIVSYATDGSIKIWDTITGNTRATLRGHPPNPDQEMRMLTRSPGQGFRSTSLGLGDPDDTITACAISPNSDSVISAGSNGTLKIWDAATGQLRATLNGHKEKVNACSTDPAGEFIVSASDDKTLKIWDSRTGQLRATLEGHEGHVTNCAVSPDGVLIASTAHDKTLKVWDVRTGEVQRTVATERDTYSDTVFSHDMSLLVTRGSEHIVKVWDVTEEQVRLTLPGHSASINDLAISKDGARLVFASSDHTLRTWDLRTGRLLATLSGHDKEVRQCELSSDGSFVVSVGEDGTLRIWDTHTGRERAPKHDGFDGSHTTLAISPDGSLVVANAGHKPELLVYDAVTGEQHTVLRGHLHSITRCVISPNGAFVVSGSGDTTLRVWETWTERAPLMLRGHGGEITTCAISPDCRLVASGSADGTVKLWSPDPIQDEGEPPTHTTLVAGCAFSPDGRFAVTGSHDGTAYIWEVETGQQIGKFTVDSDLIIDHVLVSPDSTLVVVCSSNATSGLDIKDRGTLDIWSWDRHAGSLVTHVEAHAGRINAVAFSRDGRFLVTAGADQTLKILEAREGRECHVLCGHTAGVVTCAFSPDGIFVFSAADDGTLRVWNARTGCELTALAGRAFVVHPSGEYFLVSSDAVSFTVWNLYARHESAVLIGQGVSTFPFTSITLIIPGTMPADHRSANPRNLFTGFARPSVECHISPNGMLAISTSGDRVITIWETQTGRVRAASGGYALALSADGCYLANSGEAMLGVLDLRRLRLATIPLRAKLTCAAFHPHRPQIICGDERGNVYLFALEGAEYGPIGITALEEEGKLTVRCSGCAQEIHIAEAVLGQEIVCPVPECGVRLRLNDWCVTTGRLLPFDLTPSVTPWLATKIIASPEMLTEWEWIQVEGTRRCQASDDCNAIVPFCTRPVLWMGELGKHVAVECVFCRQTICSGCAKKVRRRVQVENLDLICWQLVCPKCIVGLGNEFEWQFILYSASSGVIGGIQAQSTNLEATEPGMIAAVLARLQATLAAYQERALATVSGCMASVPVETMFKGAEQAIAEAPADTIPWLYKILLASHTSRPNDFQHGLAELRRLVAWRVDSGLSDPSFPGETELIQDLLSTASGVPALEQAQMQAHLATIVAYEEAQARNFAAQANPELAAFHERSWAYRSGGLPLGQMTRFLFNVPAQAPEPVRHFFTVLGSETSLNFTEVERDRSRVFESLMGMLSQEETLILVRRSLAYRLGRLSHIDLYEYIRDLMSLHRIDRDTFPAMRDYFDYITEAGNIDFSALTRCVWEATVRGYTTRTQTEAERATLSTLNRLYLTRLLLDYCIKTPQTQDNPVPALYRGVSRDDSDDEFLNSFIPSLREALDRVPTQNWLQRLGRHVSSLWRRSPSVSEEVTPPSRSDAIEYFPGMPLLTFYVKTRLRYYLPASRLCLTVDPQPIVRQEDNVKAYVVHIDDESVGRFTIRRSGSLLKRNFLCLLPARSAIPHYVIGLDTRRYKK